MYQELLEELRKDHISGASELAHKAARVLGLFCQEWSVKTREEFVQHFTGLAREIVRAQREITPVFNLANQSLNTLKSFSPKKETREMADLLLDYVNKFEKTSSQALELIWQQGAELMPSKSVVMTFSSSGSVLGILRQAHSVGKPKEVFICESRPLLEGRRLARMLAEESVKVKLIIDAAAGYFIPRVDLVLVGADSISETNFVNKIGTYALALLAQRHKKPVWVASEETKFVSQEARGNPAIGGDPAEIWQQSPAGVSCLNPYFELIPLDLVEKIITNQGILTPKEVPNFIRQFPLASELVEL